MIEKATKVSLTIAMVYLMAISPAFAQKGKKALAWYNEYYNQDKFNSLAGEDGILTEEDWTKSRTQKEASAFGDFRWDKAINFDADGDGALDIEEAAAYKQAERQALIENKTTLPSLYENQKWLQDHPGITKKLSTNRKWLQDHPKVATAIDENKARLNKHPKAAKKLYSNRKKLNNHPQATTKAIQHPGKARKKIQQRRRNR